jgi:Na+-driven multidrug efflux pump
LLTVVIFGIFAIILGYNLEVLTSIFTQIPEVLEKSSAENRVHGFSLPFLVSMSFFPDALKNAQLGILKALGIQKKGIGISFVGNWISNLSLMYLFIYKLEFGLHGIWLSKFISDSGIFIFNVFLVNSQDWEQISEYFFEKRTKK